MSSQFTMQKTIVLGYGGYEKIPNSLLNKIIRFETLLTAIQYFSWAKIGNPYMGVGRNLAYKKDEFFNVNGFINRLIVLSLLDVILQPLRLIDFIRVILVNGQLKKSMRM